VRHRSPPEPIGTSLSLLQSLSWDKGLRLKTKFAKTERKGVRALAD
jgi:hypothetical protein